MNRRVTETLFVSALILTSTAAVAQDAYKCKVNGAFVYQDSPCKVVAPTPRAPEAPASRPVTAPAAAAVSPAVEPVRSDAAQRLERDKAWLDERAKKREREEAQERVRYCEADAYAIQAQIDQVASTSGPSYKPNLIGVATMQLDEQRRQTDIAGLQSRVTARRAECDQLRQAYDRKYLKSGGS